jgi:hypothetical protein
VPYLLRAAETEAAVGAYRDALALVEAVRPHATGAQRATALSLRGDLPPERRIRCSDSPKFASPKETAK